MNKRQITLTVPQFDLGRAWAFACKWLLPNPGTLILMLVLALAAPTFALPLRGPNAASVSTIPYQGRLADASGDPVTDKVNIEFRIYDVPTGGAPLWEEFWTGANAVNVSDGLFSVMLGSINIDLTNVVQGYDELYLGITVGTDSEMEPRVQLGSVPFSIWSLTVADDSIDSDKIADDAVGSSEIADGSIATADIADGAVTNQKMALSYWSASLSSVVDISSITCDSSDEVASLNVDFAVDGVYLLFANVISTAGDANGRLRVEIWDESDWITGARTYSTHPVAGTNGAQESTIVTIVPFSAGSHTIRLMACMATGLGGTVHHATELIAIPLGQP